MKMLIAIRKKFEFLSVVHAESKLPTCTYILVTYPSYYYNYVLIQCAH